MPPATAIDQLVSDLYQRDSRRIFATLIRLIGDFDLAEDALHEAFAAAVATWPRDGVPANPRAWLVSTGRFKAIDSIRRKARHDKSIADIGAGLEHAQPDIDQIDDLQFNDDHLRLIFTCCHPALAPETQVALTLREVCGLKTNEVARAFLANDATIAQRIVRGKAKIREAKIPYEVPTVDQLPERLDSVLSVIYLVFNEGYSASAGDSAVRCDLSNEAIRLGRVLRNLLPDAEVLGLLALMLLHESRRTARIDAAGDIVLLEDQDRSLWSRPLIDEGQQLVKQAMATGQVGAYTVQAAISAVHAAAADARDTDWNRIVHWYDMLLQANRSPVVELNRAVAVAMRDGPAAGLEVIDTLLESGELANYHLAFAAKADLCRRLGQTEQARTHYAQALQMAKQAPEQRYLAKRLAELEA